MSRDDETKSANQNSDLHDFDRRLNAARSQAGLDKADAEEGPSANARAWGGALRAGADLAAGLLVGTGLGLLFDRAVGTGPWGMLVGLFLGFAAGMRNAIRAAQRLNASDDSVR